MASVYGCSFLNIAATGASDGSQGCFFPRRRNWRCNLFIESIAKYCEIFPDEMARNSLTDKPLASRGWALQESILLARTVQFAQTQLFWECDEKTACETFPNGLPHDLLPFGALRQWPLRPEGWGKILWAYGHRKVTKPRDKLVALSGLAKMISNETGDRYIAGLWRRGLEHQLYWHYVSTLEPGKEAATSLLSLLISSAAILAFPLPRKKTFSQFSVHCIHTCNTLYIANGVSSGGCNPLSIVL